MDLGVGERNRGIAIEWRGRRREGVRARITGGRERGGTCSNQQTYTKLQDLT